MYTTTHQFPHTRLEVFHVALEMAAVAKRVADGIPRGHRSLADQILRASSSVVLNIGEGANRITSASKRQRYSEARGECGEVAAAVALQKVLELAEDADSAEILELASRVGAMLTQLVKRFT